MELKLTAVLLEGTPVTEAGADRLKGDRPKLTVVLK